MKNKGFTLVEILIVVIILGILAAIVIPQFTEASNDARDSALQSDLQTMRSQLELFKVQHLEKYPWDINASITSDELKTILTSRTNQAGTVMPTGGAAADYPYGPYLQKCPTNSFVDTLADGFILGAAAPVGTGLSGWYVNTDTGQVFANSDVGKYAKHVTY